MQILISVQNYRPAYSFGGRVTNAIALAEELAQLGHSVTVVTTTVIERNQRPKWQGWVETINNVTVHYLGTCFSARGTSLNPSVIAFARSYIPRFDVIHIIGLYDFIGVLIASYARHYNIPYSIEPSGMLIPIVNSIWLKQVYHRIVGKILLKNAKSVVVTSKLEWNDAVKFGIQPQHLVLRANGVDLTQYQHLPSRGKFRQKWGLSGNKPLILWLGRIEKKKNIEQLLMAMSKLVDLGWQLAIVGPSESESYLQSLRNLSAELGINQQTYFIPGIYGDEKLSAYVDADIFTLVSLHENWGNTVQEAIAAGTPVLVTNTCGVAQLVKGRGGLVVERDIVAIRAGIRHLLTDSEQYQYYKNQLSDLAYSLSWTHLVKQMEAMFQIWKKEKVE